MAIAKQLSMIKINCVFWAIFNLAFFLNLEYQPQELVGDSCINHFVSWLYNFSIPSKLLISK